MAETFPKLAEIFQDINPEAVERIERSLHLIKIHILRGKISYSNGAKIRMDRKKANANNARNPRLPSPEYELPESNFIYDGEASLIEAQDELAKLRIITTNASDGLDGEGEPLGVPLDRLPKSKMITMMRTITGQVDRAIANIRRGAYGQNFGYELSSWDAAYEKARLFLARREAERVRLDAFIQNRDIDMENIRRDASGTRRQGRVRGRTRGRKRTMRRGRGRKGTMRRGRGRRRTMRRGRGRRRTR